jgi:hypothetical protein
MCFSSKTPEVVRTDPKAEAEKAAAEAAAKANSEAAARRNSRRSSALATGAGETVAGKTTLGG